MKKEKQIDIVKRKLWRFGYNVVDVHYWYQRMKAGEAKLDLLVSSDLGSIKVKVGGKDREGIDGLGEDFDVYAEVISAKKTTFIKKGDNQEIIEAKSPYLVIGRPAKK